MSEPPFPQVMAKRIAAKAIEIPVVFWMFFCWITYSFAHVTGNWAECAMEQALSLVGRLEDWANPDLRGKAPRRHRRLLYSRRLVMRQTETIESLRRQLGDKAP